MNAYIKWSAAERAVVVNELRRLAATTKSELTVAWVRRNVGQASLALVMGRQRQFLSTTEAQAMLEQVVPVRELRADCGSHGQLTVAQMVELIAQQSAVINRLDAYAAEWGCSVFDDARKYRGTEHKPKPDAVKLPTLIANHQNSTAIKRVPVAGVHDKHRAELERMSASRVDIVWIEQRADDANIKRQCSARVTVACKHGINGNVLRLMRNVSQHCHEVDGITGVTKALAAVAGMQLQH